MDERMLLYWEIMNRHEREIKKAVDIMQNLMAYGKIHTVKGVSYVDGTHEEYIQRADVWLNKNRKL